MANKFLLVPEDIYRGITAPSTGNLNLDFAARAVEKVKRKKAPPSVKNIQYNQELRRYLALRDEHENKPVKVELAGGPRILTKKNKVAVQTDELDDEDESTVTESSSSQYDTAAESKNFSRRSTTTPRGLNIARRKLPSKKKKTGRKKNNDGEQEEEEFEGTYNVSSIEDFIKGVKPEEKTTGPLTSTPSNATSAAGGHLGPSTSTPLTKEEHQVAGLSEQEAVDQLYNLLQSQPIVQGDQILATARDKVVYGSSLKESIRFLIKKNKGEIRETGKHKKIAPPGTQYIKAIIDKDATLKSYITPKTSQPQTQAKKEEIQKNLWE